MYNNKEKMFEGGFVMKRSLPIFAWILLFPFLLTACGGDEGSSNVSTTENSTTTTAVSTTTSSDSTTTTDAETPNTTTTATKPVSDVFVNDEAPDADSGVFVYKTNKGMELSFNLQQPRTKVYEYAPLIMNICGGGWTHYEVGRIPNMTMAKESFLRNKGFASLTVGFRGADHGEQMPDIVADVLDALGYISKHNDVFKIDLQKIVTAGHSAGGHLSLLVAMAPQDFLMQNCVYKNFSYKCIGSVAYMPPVMLFKDAELGVQPFPQWVGADYPNSGPDVLTHLFGVNVSSDPEPFEKYSPITYVSADMPSVLVVGGEKDTAVDHLQHIRFRDAATAAGGNCTLIIMKNGGHSFEAIGGDTSPSKADIDTASYDFVVDLLK